MSLTLDTKDFERGIAQIRKMPDSAFPEIKRGFQSFVAQLTRQAIKNSRGLLNTRTGALGRSWQSALDGNSIKSLVAEVWSGAVYSRIHEFGGVIRAKGAKYLTIPLPAAKTASGVAKGPARSFPNTFVKQSKAGNLIIFQSNKDKLVPLFVLKKQVTIPKRLGFYDAAVGLFNKMVEGLNR